MFKFILSDLADFDHVLFHHEVMRLESRMNRPEVPNFALKNKTTTTTKKQFVEYKQ